MDTHEFEGRIAIVTGASSGIGRATAIRLAAAGADVAIVGRRGGRLDQVADAIALKTSRAVLPIVVDVVQEGSAAHVVAATLERFGKLDVLVNAAGILVPGSSENTTIEAWDATMNVNLRAVFQLTQIAAPHLVSTGGNVVNVSSVTGLRAFPGVLAYCVSKAALDQLTRCTALELAPKGVRVNAVNPGVVMTEAHVSGGMDPMAYPRFLEHSKSTHPLERVGQPEEIAELIAYLVSDRAGWITGVTYSIDGGRSLTCAR